MTDRFECYTLFDITKTGILNRSRPVDGMNIDQWVHDRNTQCNFDTILQAISLRSQPENVTKPTRILLGVDNIQKFGFIYALPEKGYCWKFTFEVQHAGVFESESGDLAPLYRDVDEIPMIICGGEIPDLPTCLDTTPESKNIHFERVGS